MEAGTFVIEKVNAALRLVSSLSAGEVPLLLQAQVCRGRSRAPTLEHRKPKRDGGRDSVSNLAVACFHCNQHRAKQIAPRMVSSPECLSLRNLRDVRDHPSSLGQGEILCGTRLRRRPGLDQDGQRLLDIIWQPGPPAGV